MLVFLLPLAAWQPSLKYLRYLLLVPPRCYCSQYRAISCHDCPSDAAHPKNYLRQLSSETFKLQASWQMP